MSLYRYMPDVNKFESIVLKYGYGVNLDEYMDLARLFSKGVFIGDKLKTDELAQKVIFSLQTDIPTESQYQYNGLVMGDFTFFMMIDIPFLNEKSYQLLQQFIDPFCEVIPFIFQGKKYYILNVTTIVDCLDEKHSEYSINEVTQRISRITKRKFHQEKIGEDVHMFRVPQFKSNILISETLKSAIEKFQLTGLEFVKNKLN